ncbi:MAG: sodium-dependent transporter [Cyclobacteriaceae bacterium]|nr:sodium-dependent transporter [Cyclobacteriaceae bacterium]
MSQQHFATRITTILTMVGIAMGLGNVWRFPYMMGKYGGSAFLAVYLLLTVLFAIPAMMAESTLGQMSGKGTVDALRMSLGKKAGSFFGWMLMVVISIAGSYYAVIVGNVVFTAAFSVFPGFSDTTQSLYQSNLGLPWLQYVVTMAVVALCLYIIHRGVAKGIELLSRRVVPLFFLTLTYMIVHALTLPGAIDKCLEFLKPDLSVMGFPEVFAALGQAFFSVGLGGTFVVVYAGFLRKEEDIPMISMFTGFGDVFSSLLFAVFLIPSILVFGLDMTSGPNLIFNTLPHLFAVMPGGWLVGTFFLMSISIVGLLSLVAAYQVPFTSVINEWPTLNKGKILLTIGMAQAILVLPSCFFPSIIGPLDMIFGSGMQVFGSVLCILALTWGVKRGLVMQRMFKTGPESSFRKMVYFWIKWIIPLALLSVLLGYLYDVIL